MTAAVNEFGGWMAAPNYDKGSCYVYEGWRFGSVRRKTRRWRKAGWREIGKGRHWCNRERRSRGEREKGKRDVLSGG
jgi:hypothetical protein